MTNTHPTQNGNEPCVTPTLTPRNQPRNRWARLAFTFIPFFIYLLAERIPLPTLEHLEYSNAPEAYSVVAVGIMPWIIPAVIVGIVAAILPNSWNVHDKRILGRTYVAWVTNVVGFHIAAWQAIVKVSLLDFGGIVFDPHVSADSPHADLLGLRPYAQSPGLVFVALMAGAIFVRLLAEFVTRYGLVNGYAVFFTGQLLVSSLRMAIRKNMMNEWIDTLLLAASFIACTVLLLLVVEKLRPARGTLDSDKAKGEPAQKTAT